MDITNNIWNIKIKPSPDNNYIAQTDLIYNYKDKIIKIPKGYKTNGADIPRIFWNIIPPFKPKYIPAVIFHDYLCDIEQYKLADDVFENILFKIEKNIKTKTMIFSVRAYHLLRYNIM